MAQDFSLEGTHSFCSFLGCFCHGGRDKRQKSKFNSPLVLLQIIWLKLHLVHEFVDIILAILLHILWVWNWCKLRISHIRINKVNMGAGGCPKLSITVIVMLFLRILKIFSFSFLLAALWKKKYIYILVDDLYFRALFLNIEMFGFSYL